MLFSENVILHQDFICASRLVLEISYKIQFYHKRLVVLDIVFVFFVPQFD